MRKEVAKWQNSPDMMTSPMMTPHPGSGGELGKGQNSPSASPNLAARRQSVDKIPLLSEDIAASSGVDGGAKDVARERKVGDLPA